jgi:ribonuclease HII
MTELWRIENDLYDSGEGLICGVDEAGRGPLAGPVCAAAVILPRGLDIPGLDDSKKLTEKRREALYDVITESAVSYGIAFADHREIDELNILNATFLAMHRAIARLDPKPTLALIDGNTVKGIGCNAKSIVGGDGKSASIAAASILAKVTRDRLMYKMAEEYPEYGFERHKGYGTKLHYEALRQYGASPIHRKTFLRSCIKMTTTS